MKIVFSPIFSPRCRSLTANCDAQDIPPTYLVDERENVRRSAHCIPRIPGLRPTKRPFPRSVTCSGLLSCQPHQSPSTKKVTNDRNTVNYIGLKLPPLSTDVMWGMGGINTKADNKLAPIGPAALNTTWSGYLKKNHTHTQKKSLFFRNPTTVRQNMR